LLGLLLIAIIAAVLSPVLQYDFVAWDDDQHIYNNPHFQSMTWDKVTIFWRAPYLHLYIPLTYTVWAVVWWITQFLRLDPLSATLFHGLNLGLHLGNVLVVYRLLLLVLQHKQPTGEHSIMSAATGAILFGLHPLQIEAVAWVSGLKDVLCAWWALVALWQYGEYLRSPRRPRRWWHYGLATGAFAFALLAKPAAVVVPILAWLLATMGFGQHRLQATRALIAWLGIAILWAYWTKGQQPDTAMSYLTPWWGRPVVAADALAFYVWKLLWPVHLGPDYGRAPQVVLGHLWGYLTGLILLGLGSILWRQKVWRQRGRLAAAIFVVSLLPVLGWVPFFFQGYSTVADRYVYLALLGPALGLACGLRQLRRPGVIGVASTLLLLLLGVGSARQVRVWYNTFTLFDHALQVNPRSALAYEKLGTVLAQQEQFPAAVAYYTEALRLRPHYTTAHNNLGLALTQQGMFEDAMEHFTRALELKPDFIGAYSNLGWTLAMQGKLDEAIAQYHTALALQPDSAEVHYNLAHALARQGQLTEAITHYEQAVVFKPTWAEAHNNLGSVLDDVGRVTDAIAHYRTALQYKPEFAEAHNNLGDALLAQGHLEEAVGRFRLATRLRPTWAEAHYNLGIALTQQGQLQEAIAAYRAALHLRPGWQQAASRLATLLVLQAQPSTDDIAEAMALAELVCQATDYNDAAALYTLALAYQAATRPAALATAQRAFTLAIAEGETALAAQIISHFPLAATEHRTDAQP
jgi:Flp pilus assembly protein TadD